ncbi:MAG: four helix bundle protein [Bacteroidia bacterium]
MATVKRFEDLECWKKARELTNYIFELTKKEAFKQEYDLKSQIKSAALSSMSNIAEGFGRFSRADFKRFLTIASGSTMEVRSILYITIDQNLITQTEFEEGSEKATDTNNLIIGLIKYLKE